MRSVLADPAGPEIAGEGLVSKPLRIADVNVLIYAHREDAVDHPRYRHWLEGLLASDSAYGISEQVLSAFVRIVTHSRIFREPTPLEQALAFASEVRDRPNAVLLAPGPRHWEIFTRYCRESGVRGKHGRTVVSRNTQHFERVPSLSVRRY